jgi:hypothetical protein
MLKISWKLSSPAHHHVGVRPTRLAVSVAEVAVVAVGSPRKEEEEEEVQLLIQAWCLPGGKEI